MVNFTADDSAAAAAPHELYWALTSALAKATAALEPNQVALRFYDLMTLTFEQFGEFRPSVALFFSQMLRDDVPRPALHNDPMRHAMRTLVNEATDTPGKPEEQQALAHLLYALYLMSAMFWLYDRSIGQAASAQLLEFMREMIRFVRPMLLMPLMNKALYKLTEIMETVLGSAAQKAAAD
jgi:hypothetical protein